MLHPNIHTEDRIVRRVRAILLTGHDSVMFIKRMKPGGAPPYWVAPGGGVEDEDSSLYDALFRELHEELGAEVEVIGKAFVLEHRKAGKLLEEHFYVCQLLDYDLSLRHGPEFEDPTRGEYIPDEVLLDPVSLNAIDIKTQELGEWLLENLDYLRDL